MERKDLRAPPIWPTSRSPSIPATWRPTTLRGQAWRRSPAGTTRRAASPRAASLHPGSFAAQRDLGLSWERLDKYEDAVRAHEAALALKEQGRSARAPRLRALPRRPAAARDVGAQGALRSATTADAEVSTARPPAYEAGATSPRARRRTPARSRSSDRRIGLVPASASCAVGLEDLPGALESFEKAAQHEDVRKQAEAEATKLRETIRARRARVECPESADPRRSSAEALRRRLAQETGSNTLTPPPASQGSSPRQSARAITDCTRETGHASTSPFGSPFFVRRRPRKLAPPHAARADHRPGALLARRARSRRRRPLGPAPTPAEGPSTSRSGPVRRPAAGIGRRSHEPGRRARPAARRVPGAGVKHVQDARTPEGRALVHQRGAAGHGDAKQAVFSVREALRNVTGPTLNAGEGGVQGDNSHAARGFPPATTSTSTASGDFWRVHPQPRFQPRGTVEVLKALQSDPNSSGRASTRR